MSNGKPCEAHNLPDDICGPCKAALAERERIIAIMYEQLAYYNKQINGAKSLAFIANIENRKKGIIEAIKLARMSDLQAAEVFRKKEAK